MLSVLVRNHPGVLSHISGLFTRRGYNIESIAAGVTEDPGVTRITIVASGDEDILEQVAKQLRKLVDVIKVQKLNYAETVARELMLMTMFVPEDRRSDVISRASGIDATVVDISERTMTVEFVGNERKINTLIQLFQEYPIKELARTGYIALPLESRNGASESFMF